MESLEDFWGKLNAFHHFNSANYTCAHSFVISHTGVCLNESNKKVLWNGNDITELDDGLDQNDVEQTLELRQVGECIAFYI